MAGMGMIDVQRVRKIQAHHFFWGITGNSNRDG
jgi:hypothetical protein